MNPRDRSSRDMDEDLAPAPFMDEQERAEASWLLARDADPSTPAPSEHIATDYQRIEDLLGTLSPTAVDDSWHERVLKAAAQQTASARARRRRSVYAWTLGSTVAAAATIAIVLFYVRPAELQVTIQHGSEVRGRNEAVVGDRLVIEAVPKGAAADLRVFEANGTLVAKCPGGPGCRSRVGRHHVIELTLEKLSQYQVILVVGDADALARLPDGAMRTYLTAVRAANVRIVTYEPIDVH